MYSASNILNHGENMIFIGCYFFQGDSLIAYPRIDDMWNCEKMTLAILMESSCQTSEILFRSKVQNIKTMYLVLIRNFVYKNIKLSDYKKIHYKTYISQQVGHFVESVIEIYFEDQLISQFECSHYFKD